MGSQGWMISEDFCQPIPAHEHDTYMGDPQQALPQVIVSSTSPNVEYREIDFMEDFETRHNSSKQGIASPVCRCFGEQIWRQRR